MVDRNPILFKKSNRGVMIMEEQKVILIVEDDEVIGNSIEYSLHHLVGTEHQIPLRTLRANRTDRSHETH